MSWYPLGSRPPRDLIGARLELHHAIQLPALAIGKALLRRREDDSQTALTWRPDATQWVSEPIPYSQGLSAGLRPEGLILTLGRDAAPAARSLALTDVTLEQALSWLRDGLRAEGIDPKPVRLEPHYALPAHPVADHGAAFRGGILPGAAELGRYFANADDLLADLACEEGEASPILTWPHHFDIGRLLPAGPRKNRLAKTIGIGMSAGDTTYPEPYFYANTYPRPEAQRLPALSLGHWHTEGFFAAVLTATELLDGSASSTQRMQVQRFFEQAIGAAQEMLTDAYAVG